MRDLTVLVGGEGRHLFDSMRLSGVSCSASAEAMPTPDLIVFPCGRDRRFDNLAGLRLAPHIQERIAARSAGLVFDASLEGVSHKADIAAALHQIIDRLGAVAGQCVYLTQDRQFKTDYEAHCRSIGRAPVTVLTHDYWIWDSLASFEGDGEQVYQQRLQAFRSRERHRARRFVSLNRTPRPAKILFLLRLLRDGLWDHGHISFGGFRRNGEGPGKDRPSAEQLLQALPGFEDLIAELLPYLDSLEKVGRVLLGMDQHGWRRIDLPRASLAVDLIEYQHSWFTVVTETEMRTRPSRITEKVVKPLVNFHPVIVLGNPAALQMIRSYGFVTFPELFDESYDDDVDPRRRFERVYAEIMRLCRLGEEEWRRLAERVADKLIFNARWGLTRMPSIYRQQRDMALVNEILIAVRQSVPADR